MAKLDGIFTYDIDDLQQAVTSHVADRRKEAELAEAIITSEVENKTSKPACTPSTLYRQLCRYRIISKPSARRKSTACAAAWAT
jgi:glutamyl-tRNA reductase